MNDPQNAIRAYVADCIAGTAYLTAAFPRPASHLRNGYGVRSGRYNSSTWEVLDLTRAVSPVVFSGDLFGCLRYTGHQEIIDIQEITQ
jgi:hypothetical protein